MILYLNEPGSVLKKNENKYVVEINKEPRAEIPGERLEAVVIFSGANITTPCLMSLMERGVMVTFLSSTGKYFGCVESTAHFNIERHRNQFRVSEDTAFCLQLASSFVKGKIHNSIVLLRRYNRRTENTKVDDLINQMQVILNTKLTGANDLNVLNGVEGYASRLYFQALSLLVRSEFRFMGRNRQPPKDPFNSLLSFGYTLLMYEIYAELINRGLHPYLGFLHQIRKGHPALASDLMEEWRPVIVDSLVMSLVQGGTLTIDDFELPELDGGIYLRKERARVFIERFEQKLRAGQKYLPDHEPCSFREAVQHQVGLLVSSIERRDASLYKPIMIR